VRAAYEAGIVSRSRLARDALLNLRFRIGGATDEQAAKVRERAGAMIAGTPVRDLHRLSHRILAGVLADVYPEMLSLAHEHQDAGRPVYICTAAQQEMADILAQIFGFDGAVGSNLEVVDGAYTGRTGDRFAYGPGKSELVERLARAEGLDLAASYAYSDAASDVPLLRAVGHPVAVNPDRALARVAAQEGWPVMRVDSLRRGMRRRVAAVGALAAAGVAARALRQGAGTSERRPRV
jgi:HAD superfamily hydrolase (TIGR01490 family)